MAFLNQLATDSRSHNVLVMHTAAVAAFQEDAGCFHLPCRDRRIVLFLKGSQRLYSKPAKPKAAMTQNILEKFVRKALGKDIHKDALKAECHMWRAAIFELIAYLAMARHSDLAQVETGDIEVEDDRMTINFHTRKNDRVHKGHSVFFLATGDDLCPVALYRKYIKRLSDASGGVYWEEKGRVLPCEICGQYWCDQSGAKEGSHEHQRGPQVIRMSFWTEGWSDRLG
jgi:acyl-CoA thioesterase FadM